MVEMKALFKKGLLNAIQESWNNFDKRILL